MPSKTVKTVAILLAVLTVALINFAYSNSTSDVVGVLQSYKHTTGLSRNVSVSTLRSTLLASNLLDESFFNIRGEHDHVHFKQSDYRDVISNGHTISAVGCGWCSMSAMMAYLCPEKCESMTPADWLPIMSSDVKSMWSGGSMSWGAPRKWVDYINSLGTYGTYEIVDSYTSSTSCTDLIMPAVKQYAPSSDCVVLVSTANGVFTTGGHIICVLDTNDDGTAMHIADSASRSSNIARIQWSESAKFDWDMSVTSHKGTPYSFKCYWVVRRIS